jgi:four helix bundle protein
MAIKSHKDLEAWRAAMALARIVYSISAKWPSDERFGLISQVRRAAVSVPSNIAEGKGRGSDAEFARFCAIAYGSLMELETQLTLASEFGWFSISEFETAMFEISRVGQLCPWGAKPTLLMWVTMTRFTSLSYAKGRCR